MNTKRCTKCLVDKPTIMFSPQKFGKYGVRSWCKLCSSAHGRAYQKANNTKIHETNLRWIANNQDRYHNRRLFYKYGISYDEYKLLLDKQQHVCAICGNGETRTSKDGRTLWLSVDHDHRCCPSEKSCGRCVRGLLCWRCNTAIGKFNDDPELIMKAIQYLQKEQ